MDYQAAATPAQRTQGAAIVTAFDWGAAADATFAAQQEKAAATANLDLGGAQAGVAYDRLIRALALMILDEFNAHTTFEASMLAAIAAAASLADLKTRMAAIVPVPQRTTVQLIAAIKTKVAGTPE